MTDAFGKERQALTEPQVFLDWAATQTPNDRYFHQILEAVPAAVYTTDAEGRLAYYNPAAADLWGHCPELGKSLWCGSWKLYWPDGRPLPHDQCPMAITLKEKRAVRGVEAMAERPDGSYVHFLPFPTPFYNSQGNVVGAVNLLVDITDRKRAEQHIQRLASIVEFCNDAIASKDLNGTVLSWNRGAERLFGYLAEEMIGQSITKVIPPDRLDEETMVLDRIRKGERVEQYETIRQRKNGTPVHISLTVSPVRNAEGRIIGASKIASDITARKQLQESQDMLLREMKHRINNTLAMVQAIASQSLPSLSREERSAFNARIHALASAHDALRLANWNRSGLHDIVERALQAFQQGGRERFLIEGPSDIWLDANQSMLVAMAFHELATNAVKYGALSNASGRVRIAWEVLPNSGTQVRISWKERGGPLVETPKGKGFGSKLIERALGGSAQFDFNPQGLSCTFEVKTLAEGTPSGS